MDLSVSWPARSPKSEYRGVADLNHRNRLARGPRNLARCDAAEANRSKGSQMLATDRTDPNFTDAIGIRAGRTGKATGDRLATLRGAIR